MTLLFCTDVDSDSDADKAPSHASNSSDDDEREADERDGEVQDGPHDRHAQRNRTRLIVDARGGFLLADELGGPRPGALFLARQALSTAAHAQHAIGVGPS